MMASPVRCLPAVAVSVVIGAVVAGLVISGSPLRQRELRLDERRVADLGRLSSALTRRYAESGQLPPSIDAIVDGRFLVSLPRDPVSEESYAYEITGAASYRLCARFAREASRAAAGDFWHHPAGRHCFEFDYSAMRLD